MYCIKPEESISIQRAKYWLNYLHTNTFVLVHDVYSLCFYGSKTDMLIVYVSSLSVNYPVTARHRQNKIS